MDVLYVAVLVYLKWSLFLALWSILTCKQLTLRDATLKLPLDSVDKAPLLKTHSVSVAL